MKLSERRFWKQTTHYAMQMARLRLTAKGRPVTVSLSLLKAMTRVDDGHSYTFEDEVRRLLLREERIQVQWPLEPAMFTDVKDLPFPNISWWANIHKPVGEDTFLPSSLRFHLLKRTASGTEIRSCCGHLSLGQGDKVLPIHIGDQQCKKCQQAYARIVQALSVRRADEV